MKQRPIQWGRRHPPQMLLAIGSRAFLLLAVALLTQGCQLWETNRLTIVHGQVTDQAGQPVDSVTILLAGTKGVSAGFPIAETLSDSSGWYELAADVPKEYHSPGISLSLRTASLRSQYSVLDMLIYEDGVQTRICCFVRMGGKTNYDFVMLPR